MDERKKRVEAQKAERRAEARAKASQSSSSGRSDMSQRAC